MSNATEPKKLISSTTGGGGVAGNTTANIANVWLDLSGYDDVSIQINHKAGTGAYKIGVSNEYDARFNPNPTPVDFSARATVTGGTLSVSAVANLMVELPYPASYKAICVSYTFTSGGAAAGTDVTVNMKG